MQKNVLKKLFTSHKFDIILGTVLLATALCLFFVLPGTRHIGDYVEVKQGNDIVGVYPLNKDGRYEIKAFYGSNILVIKDGSAYMEEASCKDHICMNMGHISQVGETIICLPNEVFVKVINKDGEGGDYDAILQ